MYGIYRGVTAVASVVSRGPWAQLQNPHAVRLVTILTSYVY